jgi:hypothetical protein
MHLTQFGDKLIVVVLNLSYPQISGRLVEEIPYAYNTGSVYPKVPNTEQPRYSYGIADSLW